MSFGGGGLSGGAGTTAHVHNSQAGEGAPLQLDGDILTGTTMQIMGGAEITATALL